MNALPPFESTVCLTISRMPLCWSPSNLNPKVFWAIFSKPSKEKYWCFSMMSVLLLSTLIFLAVTKKELLGNQNTEHCLALSLKGDACEVIRLTEGRSQIDFTYLEPKKFNLIEWLQINDKIGQVHTECQSHTGHEKQSLLLKFYLCQFQWIKVGKYVLNEIKIQEGEKIRKTSQELRILFRVLSYCQSTI